MPDTWPQWLESPKHIAEAADWVRWKTQGRVRLVIAVGTRSIAVAKDREFAASDAAAVLEDLAAQIAQALKDLDGKKLTHASQRIEER